MEGVFVGRYDRKIGADGTMTVPRDWAAMLRDCPWVGIGLHPSDGCLVIGTDENEKLLSRIVVDKRGRIVIPMKLRTQAHVSDEIAAVGCVSWICIWPLERYEADCQHEDAPDGLLDSVMGTLCF